MDKKPSILFVDDERAFSGMTKEYLEAKGFEVVLLHNAYDGLAAFKEGGIDICILDVKMPMKDGFSLAEDIRKLDDRMPIIFLTGQTKKEDRIKGLEIGADDYVTKPFSMEELNLRVKAILKRVGFQQSANVQKQYNIGSFNFDPVARELSGNSGKTKLSAIEAKLLTLFCENVNELVSRDLALNKIWGQEEYFKGRSLNVYVSRLRNILKADSNIEFLNVHGEGYRMVVKTS
ncbi:MAG: response regulator transcription factor [Bacteroidota bacterium]